jgi:GT2 family glycosyltransferase
MSEHASQPKVAIIVLNWRKPAETLACLTSLAHIDYRNAQVIVVDNGSGDESVALFRQHFPEVQVLETGANLGYAGGNNVGIRYALEQGAEYICILNNDVTVTPDFLAPLLAVLHQHPDVGVVTPTIAGVKTPDRVWTLGANIDWRAGEVRRLYTDESVSAVQDIDPFEVDVAPGSAELIRQEVFKTAGLLDETFFLYYEESDWCLAVRRAGHRILAVPASVVLHAASSTLGQTSPIIDYYMLRNRLRFISRQWSGLTRWRILGSTVISNLATIAAYTVKSEHGRRLPHRTVRVLALRDAALNRWGEMGPDVAAVCRLAKSPHDRD